MWPWHKSPQAICLTAFPSFPQKPPWPPELQDQCLCSHSFFFCGMTGLRAPQWLHRSTKLIMLKFSRHHWVNANNANIFLGSNWDQRSENPQTTFGSQWFTWNNNYETYETLKPPCLRWKSSVSLFNTFSSFLTCRILLDNLVVTKNIEKTLWAQWLDLGSPPFRHSPMQWKTIGVPPRHSPSHRTHQERAHGLWGGDRACQIVRFSSESWRFRLGNILLIIVDRCWFWSVFKMNAFFNRNNVHVQWWRFRMSYCLRVQSSGWHRSSQMCMFWCFCHVEVKECSMQWRWLASESGLLRISSRFYRILINLSMFIPNLSC